MPVQVISQKKLFIFDVDGTLVDAYRAIEKSLNFTLKKLGLPPVSYQEAKRNVGRGDTLFIETFFPRGNPQRALEVYRAHHEKALLVYSKLKPYAKQVLNVLKNKGMILAVASNRPAYFTDILITKLGIKGYFDCILCADEIKSPKPNPKILNTIVKRFHVRRKETVFVGDMDIDLETAQRAKIDAVFIKGGSSTLQSVKKYANKKIVASLKEILSLYQF
jgi:phosphoglycolate phosphatase